MRKIFLAAAGVAALAVGTAGFALAQNAGDAHQGHRGGFGLFQSDSNNDGVVTRQEFDAGRDASFTRMDANNDGQLSREEMRGARGAWRHGRGGRGGGMHQLASLDTNSDGNISRDEFLARPIAMFSRMDRNNDGVISADERPQRPARAEGQEGPQRTRADRPNIDANGDHQISRAEFQAMGARMFERVDTNHDGRVTREEAEAAHPRRGPAPQTEGQ